MLQDHLSGTAVTADSSGAQVGSTMKYFPFGATRSGSVPTDIKFTGQRLDGTGLYYYGARYYDPQIGRFISADTIVPDWKNPQAWNKYSYVQNNPLKYIDKTGHFFEYALDVIAIGYDIYTLVDDPSWENGGLLALDVVLGVVPFVPAVGGFAVRGAVKGAETAKKAEQLTRNVKVGRDAENKVAKILGEGVEKHVGRGKGGREVFVDFITKDKEILEVKHVDWNAKSYEKASALNSKLKSIADQIIHQDKVKNAGEIHGGLVINRPDDPATAQKVLDYFKDKKITVQWSEDFVKTGEAIVP
jgi:RHS repeat-associated protein